MLALFRHSFRADVRFCAQVIFCDLCTNGIPRNIDDLYFLCRDHGWTLLFDREMPRNTGGTWDGEDIVISWNLSRRQLYETIPHELVHAISHSSRWEWLNRCIEGWRYERERFLEAVARMVGKMFAHQLIA